jgi:hypothetical protein
MNPEWGSTMNSHRCQPMETEIKACILRQHIALEICFKALFSNTCVCRKLMGNQ